MIIYALVDKVLRASRRRCAVRMANIVRGTQGTTRLKMLLVQEANINAVLTEELFQLQLLPRVRSAFKPASCRDLFSQAAQPYSAMNTLKVFRTARLRVLHADRETGEAGKTACHL
jgi:hypothetical protein